jgi:peptidoglycan/LPS O-acetylase OafA/YrhL
MVLITGFVVCLLQPPGAGQMFRLSLPWLLYAQNYFQTPLTFIWGHTWSLAVEEQFYILLPLLLILLTKSGGGRDDPFRAIPVIFIAFAVTCLSTRIANATITPFNVLFHLASFHTRIDSLFCGVCIFYFYHYRQALFFDAVKRFRLPAVFLGIALLVPLFLLRINDSPFIYTIGYTLLYVGGGLIIGATISDPPRKVWPIRTLAYIGSHSYSISLLSGLKPSETQLIVEFGLIDFRRMAMRT